MTEVVAIAATAKTQKNVSVHIFSKCIKGKISRSSVFYDDYIFDKLNFHTVSRNDDILFFSRCNNSGNIMNHIHFYGNFMLFNLIETSTAKFTKKYPKM